MNQSKSYVTTPFGPRGAKDYGGGSLTSLKANTALGTPGRSFSASSATASPWRRILGESMCGELVSTSTTGKRGTSTAPLAAVTDHD